MTMGQIMLYSGIGICLISIITLIVSRIIFHINGKKLKEMLNEDYDF